MFRNVPGCSGMFRDVPCSWFYRRPKGTAFALRCSNDVRLSVPSPVEDMKRVSSVSKVELRHNEGPRDWQNYFVRFNLVLFYGGSFSSISLSLG